MGEACHGHSCPPRLTGKSFGALRNQIGPSHIPPITLQKRLRRKQFSGVSDLKTCQEKLHSFTSWRMKMHLAQWRGSLVEKMV